jgi:hypothetical protein
VLLKQAQIIGYGLAGEITRVMTTHAIGYDPDIFVIMYQYRIFIF